MRDPASLIVLFAAALSAVALASAAGLKGWAGWLELRRLELAGRGGGGRSNAGARIELADLRERVRRLEAIANGAEP
ncbi:MAG TPA: hypothetical protein VEA61_03475 [Allosphingosinicella sp.]|nr:hypothetical protein [Allosphingosinicella sp.]